MSPDPHADGACKSVWISTVDCLPPIGEYVLVWLTGEPWIDDSPTVFAKVAKRVPVRGVECPNNHAFGFTWKEFGPSSWWGHSVTHWKPIEVPA